MKFHRTIRIEKRDWEHYKKLAREQGKTISEFLRQGLRQSYPLPPMYERISK